MLYSCKALGGFATKSQDLWKVELKSDELRLLREEISKQPSIQDNCQTSLVTCNKMRKERNDLRTQFTTKRETKWKDLECFYPMQVKNKRKHAQEY